MGYYDQWGQWNEDDNIFNIPGIDDINSPQNQPNITPDQAPDPFAPQAKPPVDLGTAGGQPVQAQRDPGFMDRQDQLQNFDQNTLDQMRQRAAGNSNQALNALRMAGEMTTGGGILAHSTPDAAPWVEAFNRQADQQNQIDQLDMTQHSNEEDKRSKYIDQAYDDQLASQDKARTRMVLQKDMLTKDGKTVWLDQDTHALVDSAGQPVDESTVQRKRDILQGQNGDVYTNDEFGHVNPVMVSGDGTTQGAATAAQGTPGNMKSYTDPGYDNIEAKVASEVGVPQNLIKAIRVAGEKSNSNQVSSAGASTVYQITPSTAHLIQSKYGFDPLSSPEAAAKGAALLLKESMARNGGDPVLAAREYEGGPNRGIWGPVNAAYGQRVGNFLQHQGMPAAGMMNDATLHTGGDTSDEGSDPSGGNPLFHQAGMHVLNLGPKNSATQGIEKGDDGHFYKYNPSTGHMDDIGGTDKPAGKSGSEANQWEVKEDGQGNMYRVNKVTGETAPLDGIHGKNWADPGTKIQNIDTATQLVDKILNNPGTPAAVGGWTSAVEHPIESLGNVLKGGSGSDIAQFKTDLNALQSSAFLAQVAQMKGMGALSDREGAKITAAIGNLSTSQRPEDFLNNLRIVRDNFNAAKARLQQNSTRQIPNTTGGGQRKTVNGQTYEKRADGHWYAI